MELSFSKGDLLSGQPIPPNWYTGTVIKEEIKTRDGVLDYHISVNFDDPQLRADERTIDHIFFNFMKGKNFIISFMAASLSMNVKEVADKLEAGQTVPFAFGEGQQVGKKIQFKVINEPYNGRILNKIESWLPAGVQPPL